MVTTDEDNVVRGTVVESDRLGNVRTYVEVGVDKVEEVVASKHSPRLWPIVLIILASLNIVAGFPLAALIPLALLAVWVGAQR